MTDDATREHHTVDGTRYLCHADDHYCPEPPEPAEVHTTVTVEYRLQTLQPYGAWEISSGPLGDDEEFARHALARRRERIPDAEHRLVRITTTVTVTPAPEEPRP